MAVTFLPLTSPDPSVDRSPNLKSYEIGIKVRWLEEQNICRIILIL